MELLKEKYFKVFFVCALMLFIILMGNRAECLEIKDGVYTLTVSPGIPSVHKIMAPALRIFAQNVEKKSNGKLKFNFVWGSALHKLREGFDALANNITDIAYTQPMYYPKEFPLSTYSDLPYTFSNGVVATLVTEKLYPKYFKPEFEKKGVKLLFWITTGQYQFFTKKQINTEQDLKGLKIRAGGRLQVEMMKKLGVAPVSMGSPEIYTALQRGVLDGVFYTLGAAFSYKFYEVTDHVTLTNFSQIAVPTCINPKTLAALPKDLQDIIYKEARVSGIRGSMLYYMEDAKGVDEFGKKGAKVATASKALEAEIKKLVEPIRNLYIEENEKNKLPVREMLKEMEELREKYSDLAFGNIMELQIKDPVQGIW